MAPEHKQIGEVAERTSLSLQTIRHYEEVGLVLPSARSHGGFRLYTENDIARLELVKRMKPLGLTLPETRDLLGVLDQLDAADQPPADRGDLLERLAFYRKTAEERCVHLRTQLESAEGFAHSLRHEIGRQRRAAEKAPALA